MISILCPELRGIDIYLRDETQHPTGSLKHRLAHALFLHPLCNGDVGEETTVVEASSGSTAISEAWFAIKLGLRFIAVVPEGTAPAKIAAIDELGGEMIFARAGEDVCKVARRIAAETGGHFMDQFANAATATDWRGANNIADTLFAEMDCERHPIPSWIVVGAGTGGTSMTIGRYVRLRPALAATRLCVVDPEGSAFFRAYASGDWAATGCTSRVVEGIGRNKIGALMLAQSMARRGKTGSIVTLGCDDGERYATTIYDYGWLAAAEIDVASWSEVLERLGGPGFPKHCCRVRD